MESSGYCEVLVKVQPTQKEKTIQTVLWVLTGVFFAFSILFLILGQFHLIFWPLALISLIGARIWKWRLSIEFEYQYVDGSLRIDRIRSMKKRKKWGRFELENLYVMAPEGDERVKPYLQRAGMKELDCSSRQPDANRYQLIFPNQLVILEPTEEMVRLMWRAAPNKVVRKRTTVG